MPPEKRNTKSTTAKITKTSKVSSSKSPTAQKKQPLKMRTQVVEIQSVPTVEKNQNAVLDKPIGEAISQETATPFTVADAEKTNQSSVQPTSHFQLHIEAANAPNENIKIQPAQIQPGQNPPETKKSLPINSLRATSSLQPMKLNSHQIVNKIWNFLEWIATSALIFTALFFAINYSSYSTLFMDKINALRGNIETNPYLQSIIPHQGGVTQQPLPIAGTADQNKKDIPYLNIQIAPPDDRIIIPRINRNVPIVKVNPENLIKRDWNALESDIQGALRDGVVHYPGTAEPGDKGNVVITGHSSYFTWDPGRFKDVFALLHQVNIGDTIIVYHEQQKYVYQVYDKKVVMPDQVDVLTQKSEDRLTLITCTPVGTNLKRLIVLAHPVVN